MIEIYYKKNGQVDTSENIADLENLGYDDILWIDMVTPELAEKKAVEEYLETTLQSRAQAEEIESSSRYSETESAIFTNTYFLIPTPKDYAMESVSFILCEGIIVSMREVPLRSLSDIQRRLMANYRSLPTGYHIMVAILENRIDLDADMIEVMSKEISQYSKKISGESLREDLLLDINQLQENTMMVRENVVDKQRMISSILKSDKFPRDVYTRLNVLIKDVESLLNHANFSFERLEYLQNTILGLINVEQNKIMKVFTFVSLLLMPPTLLASIYGMNVRLPMFDSPFDFWAIILVMLFSILFAFIMFRRKNMLR